jgi:hypothetical protein
MVAQLSNSVVWSSVYPVPLPKKLRVNVGGPTSGGSWAGDTTLTALSAGISSIVVRGRWV